MVYKYYICKMIKKLSELNIGEKAFIDSFDNLEISLRLIDFGIIPGEEVFIQMIAPLSDPIVINLSGCLVSLRKSEASLVKVKVNAN